MSSMNYNNKREPFAPKQEIGKGTDRNAFCNI